MRAPGVARARSMVLLLAVLLGADAPSSSRPADLAELRTLDDCVRSHVGDERWGGHTPFLFRGVVESVTLVGSADRVRFRVEDVYRGTLEGGRYVDVHIGRGFVCPVLPQFREGDEAIVPAAAVVGPDGTPKLLLATGRVLRRREVPDAAAVAVDARHGAVRCEPDEDHLVENWHALPWLTWEEAIAASRRVGAAMEGVARVVVGSACDRCDTPANAPAPR